MSERSDRCTISSAAPTSSLIFFSPSAEDVYKRQGRWYHVAGTYDGRTVKLYVNGELADSVAAPGIIQPPETAARFFVIGGDSGNQVVQYHSQTTVSFARLYSQALTAEDAALLSEEALKAVSPVDSGDMLLNVDFADGTAADTAGGRPPRAQGEPCLLYTSRCV